MSGVGGNRTIGERVYRVTCGLCGQNWLQNSAADDQAVQCMFCGSVGRLRVGGLPPILTGASHVEVRLECRREGQ